MNNTKHVLPKQLVAVITIFLDSKMLKNPQKMFFFFNCYDCI